MTAKSGHVGQCPTCGKRLYLTRADARKAIKSLRAKRDGMSAYRCGGYWHFGHLPRTVRAGRLTRTDIFPKGTP